MLDDTTNHLPSEVRLQYVMGGLARDSDKPMSEETRSYVQQAWSQVTATTGAQFNWAFWDKCEPRRSTYPACRAALAAGLQGKLPEMFAALQRAYYLEARNPSDTSTHLELAAELDLDPDQFSDDLASTRVKDLLQDDFACRRKLRVSEFPSLILEKDGTRHPIVRGWADLDTVRDRIASCLASG